MLRKKTWISWPLAFILRSGAAANKGDGGDGGGARGRAEDVAVMAEKEVSMRSVVILIHTYSTCTYTDQISFRNVFPVN